MAQLFDAISKGLRDVFQFQVLWIMIWPMLAAVFLWVILGALLWTTFAGWIEAGLVAIGAQAYLQGLESDWIANGVQAFLHLLLFVPLVFLTALLITAIFAMPALIKLVAERHYPELVRECRASLMANIVNALVAIAIFVLIWVVSLPLWLFGVGFLIPLVAVSYLNQRLFRFDALSEHATQTERETLFKQYQGKWWALGVMTALLQFLPLVNLIAPVVTALIFIHFALARLQELRASSVPQEIVLDVNP